MSAATVRHAGACGSTGCLLGCSGTAAHAREENHVPLDSLDHGMTRQDDAEGFECFD